MTAAFLQSELTNLVSDSKRKHADVKAAAERSLSELKSISVTSESQLAGDLIRKTHFVDPFVLACKSQNVKIASTGAASLQRLVASTAIPRSRLPDVLQAFEEAVPLGLDVQLKVLQTLPSLLQLYAADLHGEALSRTLSVSADLSSSKLPIVSSTAGATFQQLVSAVFTRAVATSKSSSNKQSEDQDSARNSEDAFAIFVDLCALLTEEDPQFVRLENLPPPSILETLEGLLSAHGAFVLEDGDALKACSVRLMPGLAALIESSANFGVVVRAVRIAFILGTRHLNKLRSVSGDLFKLILRISDRPGTHKWKRLLGLEFFRGFCSDFEALRLAYATFDLEEKRANIVSDFMASLVRTASEDPSLIGLGRQSTIPNLRPPEGGADITSAAEVSVGSVAQAENSSTGISAELSTVTTPCLDLYDRTTPPETPETYVYTLVLGCISSFSDGLSKFIMPLSVPNRKSSKIEELVAETADEQRPQRKSSLRDTPAAQKPQHLVNPLTRKDIGKRTAVEDCAKMIESCWPAVLATCSTFLSSALDSYFYHMLIRTVQKLTQVSGVLELNTPRDALLTTLAKVSVPANVSNLMNNFYGGNPALQQETASLQEEEEVSVKSPIVSTPRQSVDLSHQTLNIRNLLCLRALLNLGIALGPTLSRAAWTIIMQSLEQVEALMSVGPNARIAQMVSSTTETSDGGSSTLVGEIAAVDTARRRMVESTRTYPESSFRQVCEALFHMIEDAIPAPAAGDEKQTRSNGGLRPIAQTHKSTRSVSGTWAKAAILEIEVQFVLKTIGRLAHVNLHRFQEQQSSSISWDLIITQLLLLQSNQKLQSHLRLQSANIIDAVVVEACTASVEEAQDDVDDHVSNIDRSSIMLKYGIPALGKQFESTKITLANGKKSSEIDVRIIQTMLEALHNLVGSRGEDLGSGWAEVFKILVMVATEAGNAHEALYPSAFKVAQLVVSDFLTTLDNHSLAALLRLFARFGSQSFDLNMSLTTIALYWNLAAIVTEETDSLHPFTATKSYQTETPANQVDSKSDLWHKLIYSLVELSKDARSDSRNAAARMLTKVVEASVPSMQSQTLNSCLTHILLPLIDFYTVKCSQGNEGWQLSASNLIQDVVKMMQNHGSLLLQHDTFDNAWVRLIHSTTGFFKAKDNAMTMVAFDALSSIINSMCQLDDAAKFRSKPEMLAAAWNIWKDYQPADTSVKEPNQAALASHAQLWLELMAWNDESLASFEDVVMITLQVVKASIFSARHDPYTLDVQRTSSEQEKILGILRSLNGMAVTEKRVYAQFLVDITQSMTRRTTDAMHQPVQSKSDAKGTRQPTCIAFATACVEVLRKVLREDFRNVKLWHDLPISEILQLSASLTATKYSALPTNEKNPLWQRACLLGIECATGVSEHCHGEENELESIGQPIYDLLAAILETRHLESMAPEERPSKEKLAEDETFDIAQLEHLHVAMKSIFRSDAIPQPIQKRCVLILFNYSLIARPWYNDLTADLEKDPLNGFTKIRRGSIRSPNLPIRGRIYRHALQCLFDHASNTSKRHEGSKHSIASIAAPYVLLRLSHTLKTFIADQPLRYLEHPHIAVQEELHLVLRKFLDTRVTDNAFISPARYLSCGKMLDEGDHEFDVSTVIRDDAKSHLRIMWGLVIRFEELWYQLPRLKKGHAWQDHDHGRGVEQCLKEWKEAIGERWGVAF